MCEQSLTTGLTRDRRFRGIRVRPTRLARINATVGKGEEHHAFVIHCRIGEIEQVSAWIIAATIPDAGIPLHRSSRCSIDGSPGLTAVVGVSDESVPRAGEVGCLVIARCGRPKESYGGTV